MATRGLSLFSVLLALLALVAADTSFISPPQPGSAGDFTQNPTYSLGDEINIKWKSALRHVSIQVWRAYPPMLDSERPVAILGNAEGNKMPWSVDVTWPKDLDKSEPAVYYFSLYEPDDTKPHANSHYFNVTTTANGDTAKAGLELRSDKGQPQTAADDEVPVGNPGLSKKGKIALALSCTIGGSIVLGSIAYVAYWTMRHNRERVYYDEEESEAAELHEDGEAVEYHDEKSEKDFKDDKDDKNETEEKVTRRRSKPTSDVDEIREIS